MDTVEWKVSGAPVPYAEAVRIMEARVAAIRAGSACELIWLLEHPPLLTAGTSARLADLRDPERFPVHVSGRGGQYTWHGPGQRVVYVMLDLARRGRDVRGFVSALEDWGIAGLGRLGIASTAVPGRVGIWTPAGGAEAKIAAIGVRVRHWVTFHGLAINVDPNLSSFDAIRPCGLDAAVTSVRALGNASTMAEIDGALSATLPLFLERLSLEASNGIA